MLFGIYDLVTLILIASVNCFMNLFGLLQEVFYLKLEIKFRKILIRNDIFTILVWMLCRINSLDNDIPLFWISSQ